VREGEVFHAAGASIPNVHGLPCRAGPTHSDVASVDGMIQAGEGTKPDPSPTHPHICAATPRVAASTITECCIPTRSGRDVQADQAVTCAQPQKRRGRLRHWIPWRPVGHHLLDSSQHQAGQGHDP
jgi:hypothetical protein